MSGRGIALPRILFWESSDERVAEVASKRDNTFHPVLLRGDGPAPVDVETIDGGFVEAEWMNRRPGESRLPREGAEIAAAALALGLVDGAVGGAAHTSEVVLRAGLRYVGATGTVSMAMLATPPDSGLVGRSVMLADCAVVPHPTSLQMAEIAIASAESWERATGAKALVAFVASTSKSGADTPEIQRIQDAISIVRKRCPELQVDGELQIDAALSPEVALRKLGSGGLGGYANVLVFPDLVSANSAYKILQHMAGYQIAPITQCFAKPFFDVSRGCSLSELRAAALQCAAQAERMLAKQTREKFDAS